MTPLRDLNKQLKPCPICGESVGLYRLGDWMIIRCPCGLKIEKHMPVEELVERWNNRVCNCGREAQQEAFCREYGAEPAPMLPLQPEPPTQDDLFEKAFGK